MTTMIAFAPQHNKPGKSDADEFRKEARLFLKYHQQPASNLFIIDNSKTDYSMRKQVLEALEQTHDADLVAFFCHGPSSARIQFGFGVGNVGMLADGIAATGATIVPLYCCMVGKPGGFAGRLRDAMCERDLFPCDVYGHSTAGHTSENPYVIFYQGITRCGGPGGMQLVPTDNKRLWNRWMEALKGDLRFKYPTITTRELHIELCPD